MITYFLNNILLMFFFQYFFLFRPGIRRDTFFNRLFGGLLSLCLIILSIVGIFLRNKLWIPALWGAHQMISNRKIQEISKSVLKCKIRVRASILFRSICILPLAKQDLEFEDKMWESKSLTDTLGFDIEILSTLYPSTN